MSRRPIAVFAGLMLVVAACTDTLGADADGVDAGREVPAGPSPTVLPQVQPPDLAEVAFNEFRRLP